MGWLQPLSSAEITTLAGMGEERSFDRGTYLFQEGDEATAFFVVLRGRVELTSTTADGTQRLHSILRDGNAFGEAELLTESPRMTTALTVEAAAVWRCKRSGFTEFVAANPTVLRSLLGDLVRRMQALDDLVQDLTALPLKGRVAKALMALALPPEGGPLPRRSASIAAQTADEPAGTMEITQGDLAKLCGGTRENVARAVAELQRRGAIARNGHSYELLDPAYLRRLARLS